MLIGDGDLRQEVQSLIKELKLEDKIILTGWRKDVENLIHIFDVFIFLLYGKVCQGFFHKLCVQVCLLWQQKLMEQVKL